MRLFWMIVAILLGCLLNYATGATITYDIDVFSGDQYLQSSSAIKRGGYGVNGWTTPQWQNEYGNFIGSQFAEITYKFDSPYFISQAYGFFQGSTKNGATIDVEVSPNLLAWQTVPVNTLVDISSILHDSKTVYVSTILFGWSPLDVRFMDTPTIPHDSSTIFHLELMGGSVPAPEPKAWQLAAIAMMIFFLYNCLWHKNLTR